MGESTEGLADKSLAFIHALKKLQKDCGVDTLKMSDFGIKEADLDKFAKNAKETMGALFDLDCYDLTHEDTVAIYKKAYK